MTRASVEDPVLLGDSRVMREARDSIEILAPLPWHVRIEGPTGTGKRIAASLLHCKSARSRGPFVPCYVNMLPDEVALDALVGHVRGAFTGAVNDRAGAAECANGGTLCLDEIGTASPRVQLALLQLVDQGVVQRIGESRLRTVDTRMLFLTNVDLEAAVRDGDFRDDLYWRLGQLIVRMPALAAHREDIPLLVERILARKRDEARVAGRSLTTREMDRLVEYHWPGNVRELELALEYHVAFGLLPERVASCAPADWRSQMDRVLQRHGGNKAAAARDLGISRKTLFNALRQRRQGVTGDGLEASG